ncbi:MAG: 3-keto-disaccharide hydrolase [Verrucomicrobiales bacterium]
MRLKLLAVLLIAAQALGATENFKFVPLFNGKDLTGWTGDGYIVEDGAIVCTPKGRNLVTESLYTNYVLDFEFKLPPGGNNGIGIHYPGTGDAAYTGMELQILDNTAEKYKDLKPYQFHGSIYTMVPAKRGHLKPVGEWNSQRITVNGDDIRIELNGTVITEANLAELREKFPKHQGVKRSTGHLALCGHGDRVAYRAMKICELPPGANIKGATETGFLPLFDGSSLDGWKVPEGGEAHWVPINGILKYDGKSKDLWTEKSYKDFSLAFDWRWSKPGPMQERPILGKDGKPTGEKVEVQELDSGIYVRGNTTSQINLWNWPAGSGEVYGYRTDGKQSDEVRAGVTPLVKADRPIGEWNRMFIMMKGNQLTVHLNGAEVIRQATLHGVKEEGPIGLHHHHAAIDYANLYIRE